MPKAPKSRAASSSEDKRLTVKGDESSLRTKFWNNRKTWTPHGAHRRPRDRAQNSLSRKFRYHARHLNLNQKISLESKEYSAVESQIEARNFSVKHKQTCHNRCQIQAAPAVFASEDTSESTSRLNTYWTPITRPLQSPHQSTQATIEGTSDLAEGTSLGRTKNEKEKQRAREHKKRQRAAKQSHSEEERLQLEAAARCKEAETPGPSRFLVRLPLSKVSDLSGRSVCRNFRRPDLDLNGIQAVQLDAINANVHARRVLDCIRGPLYFHEDCAERLAGLKERLGNEPVCLKLKIEESNPSGASTQRQALGVEVVDAIVHVLQDAEAPRELESSQNSEEKIKSLFKPILRSMGLDNVVVTSGFNWKEGIGLRSTIDLGTHVYSPRSDVAIVQVLSKKNAQILVIFEAFSKLGQSVKTPDENRADRVRLLIQGSYISQRDSKPAVVFYLTHDKVMETILVCSSQTVDNDEKVSFMYYAERLPFYSESTWVDLICQVVNLVLDRI